MREVFSSEAKCIQNVLASWSPAHNPGLPTLVFEEFYSEPRARHRGPRFNTDFTLYFVPSTERPAERECFSSRILPNTIGADLFLVVDRESFRPLVLDLIAGEAFAMKYYHEYVARIEAALSLVVADGSRDVRAAARSVLQRTGGKECFLSAACLKSSAYCRILVVGGDACFLFFPTIKEPEMRGTRYTLLHSDGCRVDCYVDGSEIVCFDGWVQVKVVESEWKLEAIWKGDLRDEVHGNDVDPG